MNPYNFVPLGPAAPRRKVRTHESYGQSLHAGTLVCRIKTLTEIFVAEPHERAESNQHQELRFVREDGKPIIPGSSLKGSIRSVASSDKRFVKSLILQAQYTNTLTRDLDSQSRLPRWPTDQGARNAG